MKGIILYLVASACLVSCSHKSGASHPSTPPQAEQNNYKLIDEQLTENCTMGSKEAIEVCDGLNRIRAQNGKPALWSDRHLTQVATAYAREMYEQGKLTHGDFSGRMKHAGIPYPVAENIAHGQRTPEQVLRSWTNSPGHFSNMIGPDYKTVGVGYYQGYWVQILSGGQR